MFCLNCRCERHVVTLFVRRSFLSFWALLPLEDLQDPVVCTCTLRKWNPRPACGTAFSSVHNISSVCVCVCVCVCVAFCYLCHDAMIYQICTNLCSSSPVRRPNPGIGCHAYVWALGQMPQKEQMSRSRHGSCSGTFVWRAPHVERRA